MNVNSINRLIRMYLSVACLIPFLTSAAVSYDMVADPFRPDGFGIPAIRKNVQLAATDPCIDGWYEGLPVSGVNGDVSAIAFDDSGALYVGGSFTIAGNLAVNNIAKWDGTSWSPLGTGTNGKVSALAVSGTDIYAGGSFTTAGGTPANYIAKWNGSNWSPMESGPGIPVDDIEVSGADIYLGGGWYDNGTWEGYVAKWNGSSWLSLGPGMNDIVSDIAVLGSDIYAGGRFTTVGGESANHIAKWNGSSWSELGPGQNGEVKSIAVSGTDVYAGINSVSGQLSTGYVAKWDGTSWSELGTGMTYPQSYVSVNTIAVSGTDVYAAGQFTLAGGTPAIGLAKWNGSSWSGVGSGGMPNASAMAVSGADVVVSGGGELAQWSGSSWSALGSNGQVSKVKALTVSSTDIYAAGYFTTDGGTAFSRAAIWNGSGWTRLGSWPDEPDGPLEVKAIAVSGMDIYVAGIRFNNTLTARGVVFKWNGSNWSEFSFVGIINTLASSGPDIYAGGYFRPAGGIPANSIAKWNGSNWSSLGTGIDGEVDAIAVFGTDVYTGGQFTTAGGTPARDFAKWNGSSWLSLGLRPANLPVRNSPEDFCCRVYDVELFGSDIYVARGFDDSYGSGMGIVLKWNGSGWVELPRMCCNPIDDIALSGSDVYAGGSFTTAGGTPVNRIAKWNGSTWSPLGSGLNGDVRAIAVHGADLFVGGDFTTAGCHVSAYFARYSLPSASVSGRVTTPAGLGLRNAVVSITDSNGVRQTTTTSTFGYYSFENVLLGGIYTISVSSRRYRFTPRTLGVNDNLSNIDFIGLE